MKFLNKDKEKFGTIKDVTDKAYYTNSNLEGNTELLKILEAESKNEKMSLSEKNVDIKQNKINDKIDPKTTRNKEKIINNLYLLNSFIKRERDFFKSFGLEFSLLLCI